MRGLVRPHLSAVEFLIGVSGYSQPSRMYLMATIATIATIATLATIATIAYGYNSHRFLGQAAPGTPQQLRCFHPGVDQDDQLYLPSTPGTHKSGAPPLSWI